MYHLQTIRIVLLGTLLGNPRFPDGLASNLILKLNLNPCCTANGIQPAMTIDLTVFIHVHRVFLKSGIYIWIWICLNERVLLHQIVCVV